MPEPSPFTVQRDVPQVMRDGTILRADVYLPKDGGPFPALLERTPYSKDNSPECQVGAPPFFASHGYAVVIQDVRGRFASEGRFVPFHDDGWGPTRDGYDTVEWVAAQPWCDGQVGTIGGSYAGATQYRLAPTRPPHLRAMYVRESSADYWAEWVYRGGAFELAFMLEWTVKWTYNNLARLAPSPEEHARRKGILEKALGDLESWHRQRPLHPNPLVEGLDDWFNEFLAHPADGPFWWRWNITHQHAEVDTPIVHLGGWFDIFLAGTLKNFVGLRAKARSPAARDAQRLVIGPWVHGPWNMAKSVQGEVDFGADAVWDYNAKRLPWFEHWLKKARNDVQDEPRVQLFVMGENRWRAAEEYPLPGTRYTPWYLRDGGALAADAPAGAESAEGYRYDPDDPVPTLGGATLNIPGGAYDQRPIEGLAVRCLTYTSAPLERDLTIVGDVRCVLHAMSSAPDTDFVVRLTDVQPDGFSRLLCDGILRARYRESGAHPTPLTPNQVYELTVDLWATANTFRRGHRIRVAVTSSSFPRFDRNPNTGGPVAAEARGQVALNTVFHDARRPSRILLPVIES
ncbi:MAG TPA: CocE/NonD family hydrolase [Methylomirabilota bacterium]|nr:CocE/NonD family hydrolase [Methylomirabilota bacterium]